MAFKPIGDVTSTEQMQDLKKRWLEPMEGDELREQQAREEEEQKKYRYIDQLLIEKDHRVIYPDEYQYMLKAIKEDKGLQYIFYGGVGNGKTCLAEAVYRTVQKIHNPLNPVFNNAKKMWQRYKELMGSNADDRNEQIKNLQDSMDDTRLYILDDLGTEIGDHLIGEHDKKAAEFMFGILARLYDRIKASAKPFYCIMTTNYYPDELIKIYGVRGFDRIKAIFNDIEFNNDKFRIVTRQRHIVFENPNSPRNPKTKPPR